MVSTGNGQGMESIQRSNNLSTLEIQLEQIERAAEEKKEVIMMGDAKSVQTNGTVASINTKK